MDLGDLRGAVLAIALIALVGAAAAIALDDFKEDLLTCESGFAVNASACGTPQPCYNASHEGNFGVCKGTTSYAYNETLDGLDGVTNSTSFLDTIGTILGVAVLIGLVVLAFSFGAKQ